MKNTIAISIIALIFALPFFSAAQIRENFDWRFFSLFLVILPILYYIYSTGKTINDEFDKKYNFLGSKGGRAKRTKEKTDKTKTKAV